MCYPPVTVKLCITWSEVLVSEVVMSGVIYVLSTCHCQIVYHVVRSAGQWRPNDVQDVGQNPWPPEESPRWARAARCCRAIISAAARWSSRSRGLQQWPESQRRWEDNWRPRRRGGGGQDLRPPAARMKKTTIQFCKINYCRIVVLSFNSVVAAVWKAKQKR